jgi:regulator of sigma E protease
VHNIQGPVGILPAWWYEIAMGGIRRGLVIAVLLNINLAIINLLPIPILDGGHIAFALAEIMDRRPLNARLVHVTSLTVAALLISFMVYVSVNNFEQWFLTGHAKSRSTEHSNETPPIETPTPQP